MALIHPTAQIDPAADLAPDVSVGAFAIVGPRVTVGPGTTIGPHAILEGPTTIGRNNRIHAHAVIGGAPQDKKYRGEPTRLEIGDGNTFREFVTVNRGTVQDAGVTRIGSDNWVMAYVHVAHDCIVGDHVILANTTNLAGHVHIGDWVILGGYTGVHQFCKIGAHAMTGVGTVVLHDIPPFVMASGNTASAHGLNIEGLRRRGFDADTLAVLRRAYRTLYRSELTFQQARERLAADLAALASAAAEGAGSPETPRAGEGAVTAALDQAGALRHLTDFLGRVERGIVR
jgi:UDP-N-acetylglucosamine acyltransferase